MKTSARPLILCSLAASGALLLGACGKHDTSSEAPAPASTAAPTPMTPTTPAPMPSSTAPAPAMPASGSLPSPAGTAPAPAPASTTASAGAAAGPFAVSKVVVGDAVTATHAVAAARDTIAPDHKAIYASVETSGKTDGATLSARWSYLEGKGQLVSAISQSIATEGPAVTTFKIQNPNAWPAGKYQVEISLDGKPVSTRSFAVKAQS